MTPTELLADVVRKLDAVAIVHMIAGSVASSLHGVPRTTNDVDIVIDPSLEQLDRFIALLAPESYYADADMARDALKRRSMFNVIHLASGWKLDFIVCKPRPFSRCELARREHGLVFGVEVFVASPEDTILAKLEWAKLGESERQLRDVRGIIEAQAEHLDVGYIERWVEELGLRAEWSRAQIRR